MEAIVSDSSDGSDFSLAKLLKETETGKKVVEVHPVLSWSTVLEKVYNNTCTKRDLLSFCILFCSLIGVKLIAISCTAA
jgi:hypothetical protein